MMRIRMGATQHSHMPRRNRRAKKARNEVVEACSMRMAPQTTMLAPVKEEVINTGINTGGT